MAEYVTILERWTWEGGYRKIGSGPWERIEPLGFVPFVQIKPGKIDEWLTETLVSPQEAKLLTDGSL